MSPPVVAGFASTSLMTTEPGLGIGLVSSPPGEPFGAVLARQPSAEFQSEVACSGSRTVSEKPSPSVCLYQSSL